MAFVSTTDANHTRWDLVGTSTDGNNRLSDAIDDQPEGPYYRIASGGSNWTAGSGSEYYNTPTNRPDNLEDDGVQLTEVADDSMGSLNSGEWCWDTGNSRVYARLSDDIDPDNSNMDLYYDWDGGGYSGTQFLLELAEDVLYHIPGYCRVGDGSTTTVLETQKEMIYAYRLEIYLFYTTFIMGEKTTDGYAKNGSTLTIYDSSCLALTYISSIKMYDSRINLVRSGDFEFQCMSGSEFINSSINGYSTSSNNYFKIQASFGTINIETLIMSNFELIDFRPGTTSPVSGMRLHESGGFEVNSNTTVRGCLVTDGVGSYDYRILATSFLRLVDPVSFAYSQISTTDFCYAYLYFTMSIRVVDSNGNPISGATVTLRENNGSIADERIGGSNYCTDTTDANGEITPWEVLISMKNGVSPWVHYGPFDLEISMNGYRDFVLADIDWQTDYNGPLDWTINLDPFLYPESVRRIA